MQRPAQPGDRARRPRQAVEGERVGDQGGDERRAPGQRPSTRRPRPRWRPPPHRQRGERSRPSGSSSGRVTPRAMAGAHSSSRTAAWTCASRGSGRPVAARLLTQASRYIQRPDQARGRQQPADRVARPARADDQPEHGEAEVQRGGQRALGEHGQVRGRTRTRATARPAARQPKVAANSSQASTVRVRGGRVTGGPRLGVGPASAGPAASPAGPGRSMPGRRYGTVAVPPAGVVVACDDAP